MDKEYSNQLSKEKKKYSPKNSSVRRKIKKLPRKLGAKILVLIITPFKMLNTNNKSKNSPLFFMKSSFLSRIMNRSHFCPFHKAKNKSP